MSQLSPTGKRFYILLLVIAALINIAGYTLTLWHEATIFDEVVHFVTAFAVTSGFGRLLVATQSVHHAAPLAVLMIAGALLIGITWEGFEWLIGIIGDTRDTLTDLVMDTVGAVAATVLVIFTFRSSQLTHR